MINGDNEILNVYVDIDSVMDTRLPLIYFIDEELANKITTDGSYYNRFIDEFDYITSNIFSPLYKDRNKTLLSLATPTHIMKLIKEYINEVVYSDKSIDGTGEVKLYFNIYPYALTLTEIAYMEAGLVKTLPGIDIKIVSMKQSEVTPKWINANVSIMIMYKGIEWVELHTSTLDLIKCPLVDVTMLTPALILGNKAAIKSVDNGDEFFNEIESKLTTLIKIKMLPVNDFCKQV